MASSTKTVKITATFAVVDAANVASPNKVIKDLNLTVAQVQTSDPMCIPGATSDFSVPFGQITAGKRIYLSTDQPVTVKFNQNTDVGFEWDGSGIVPSGSTGISALFITTGASATTVEVVVAGD